MTSCRLVSASHGHIQLSEIDAGDAISINSFSALAESTKKKDLFDPFLYSPRHSIPRIPSRLIKKFKKETNVTKDKDRYLPDSLGMNGRLVQWPYTYVEGQPQGDNVQWQTIDVNIGVGRVIDAFFFQPIKMDIKPFATQQSMTPSPDQIAQFILANLSGFDASLWRDEEAGGVVAEISELGNGSVIVAGLRSLVKQTQYVHGLFQKSDRTQTSII